MAATTSGELLTTVKNLLDSGKYSDLTITCGDETHKVHKNIVCTRCGFFERAERFAIGREAAENAISLPEDEPKIIALLLEFLYTSEYTPKLPANDSPANALPRSRFPHSCDPSHMFPRLCAHHTCGVNCRYDCRAFTCRFCPAIPPKGDDSQLLLHSKLYSLADKYDVPGLQDLAAVKFKTACAVFWKMEAFPAVAEHVFTSTPDADMGLRTIVKMLLLEHRQDLVKKDGIKSFLEKRPELMYELLVHNAEAGRDNGSEEEDSDWVARW
ncbi:hypothetical protein HBH69_185290 [Parastagonospora nodorum]|nr:hypothetical protein HBI76_190880 [Parastagonospora nodorum]KAH5145202.1 hypothetical protein HBH69_185290 [Parastagonospora nodorum]KAH6203560.1 hypothetical protein HBI43_207700 [Parastagonospora nodorum]KAH6246456.1 hypothetical protein HBI42_189190 [Parastagonospora nodorum]